ncbi:MAG: helix-turn-helix transcriptional regulator [Vicinamibacterales bacterium]
MSRRDSLSDLILGIYRAAEDPRAWSAALDAIRHAVGASGAAVVHQEFPITGRNVNAYSGFSEEAIKAYEAYYYQIDPWGRALTPADWRPGRVIDGREIVTPSAVARSEWLADFGHQHGCAKSMFGILEPFGTRVAALTLNRGASQPDFADAEHRLVRALTPHLRQAFRVHRRIVDADHARGHSLAALDRLAMGVILVNASGRVVFINTAASRIVSRRDGLSVDHGRLVGASPIETRALGDAVTTAVRLAAGAALVDTSAALELPRPSATAPLRVVVVPCVAADQAIGREVSASAAVFVSDPDARALDGATLVAQLFHLTPAEARVAERLVDGETVQEMADGLELTPNTVRWHLKHVLQKADAKTQAQFVSRVLRSPAWLRLSTGPVG